MHLGTFNEVLDGFPHASVEGPSVSGALKSEPKLPVVDFPVVEGWVRLGVHQVLLHEALQHHLGGREPKRGAKSLFPCEGQSCHRFSPDQSFPLPKSKPSHDSHYAGRGTSFPTKL